MRVIDNSPGGAGRERSLAVVAAERLAHATAEDRLRMIGVLLDKLVDKRVLTLDEVGQDILETYCLEKAE